MKGSHDQSASSNMSRRWSGASVHVPVTLSTQGCVQFLTSPPVCVPEADWLRRRGGREEGGRDGGRGRRGSVCSEGCKVLV